MLSLPAELVLAVLAYLPLDSIAIIPQVSRSWNTFVANNRGAIYHKAAVFHAFIPSPSTSLEELNIWYSQRSMKGVYDWQDLCRRRYDIDRSWSAKGPSTITSHTATGTTVHRIKVDEKAGYILTTKFDGGLTVTDLNEEVVLWSLPKTHVRSYAHCEYGEGFIVFDRFDGSKEVWRRSSDCTPEEASCVVPESQPTILTSEFLTLPSCQSTPSHGHFQPWAHLHPPEHTRAFRFSYPTLGVAAMNHVYLWDVRTGALIQTIEGTQLNGMPGTIGLRFLGDINYVELGERHVLLCGIHKLKVFARNTGRCVLDVPSSRKSYGRWWFGVSSEGGNCRVPGAVAVRHDVVAREQHEGRGEVIDEFIAVHISSCGRHLAALLHSSRLVIIPDFEHVASDEVSLFDITFEVQLGSPDLSARYLAYENGRIAVATRTGIFIVRPDFSSPSSAEWSNPPAGEDGYVMPPSTVEIVRIPCLSNRSSLGKVTCLQMTDTGLFLNWDPNMLNDDDDDEDEALFYESLQDEPQYANVSPDVQVVLVDMDELETDLQPSTVLSVDFTPL